MASVKVIKNFDEVFVSEDVADKNGKELENYLACVAGKEDFAKQITGFRFFQTQSSLSPQARELVKKVFKKVVSGKMKVDGTPGNWNNGIFGSRWFDIDSASLEIECRVGFYTRKSLNKDDGYPYYLSFDFNEREETKCFNPECEKRSKSFKKCSCCQYVQYCGTSCQKADWKRHKAEVEENEKSYFG